MKIFPIIVLALFAAAPLWAASGKTQTYNTPGQVVSDATILDNETGENADSTNNKITFGSNAGTFNANVTAAQSETGNANQNTIIVQGGTINSPNLTTALAKKGDATDNVLTVQNVTLSSNLTAGSATAGKANNNTVNISKATIAANSTNNNTIYAGATTTGEAVKNTVNISESTVTADIVAGYSAGAANVNNNTVSFSKTGAFTGKAMGGYAKDGDATYNTVAVADSFNASAGSLYGGYSASGSATNNAVTLKNTASAGSVYGGYSESGKSASSNVVTVSDSATVSTLLAGGYSSETANAVSNSVVVKSNGLNAAAVTYGGYSNKGGAGYNTVQITGTSIGDKVYGGYAEEGELVASNKVLLSGTNGASATSAHGGYAGKGNATGNAIYVTSDLTLTGGLYGAETAQTGSASGNVASLAGSIFTGNVYGAKADQGYASANAAYVSGGSVTGNVYGGYSTAGAASGNYVSLASTTINGDVYGGFSANNSETSNNTIYLSGNTVITGNFYGGNGTTAKNNSLVLDNYTGTINALNAIDNVLLQGLSSNVTFTTDVDAKVKLTGRPSESTQTIAHTTAGSTLALTSDALGVYRYDLSSILNGSTLDWTVTGLFDQNLAKPYAQIPLAGLALATMGDDMLDRVLQDAMNPENDKRTFVGMQYFDRKYKTGSGFDMNSFVFQGGNYMPFDRWTLGFFGQYAHGAYDTFPVKAKGDVNSFAGGAFALLPVNDILFLEGTARLGYQQTSFDANQLSSQLDLNSFFYGLSGAMIGKFETFTVYGKMSWLRKQGKSTSDSIGQEVKADAVQSLTGEAGLRVNLPEFAYGYRPFAGLAGVYELDGDSNVRIDGHTIAGDTSLKGFTAKTELGLEYDNFEPVLPLKSMFSLFGLFGQNAGWGGEIKLAFEF